MLLTYVSGSTSIFGIESLNFISFFPMLRQFLTTSTRFRRLYDSIVPEETDAWETKVMDVWGLKVWGGGWCLVRFDLEDARSMTRDKNRTKGFLPQTCGA